TAYADGPLVIVYGFQVPAPDRDAGGLRMFLILRSMAEWARPVFVPLHPKARPEYEALLGDAGVGICYQPDDEQLIKSGNFKIAILSQAPVADVMLRRI